MCYSMDDEQEENEKKKVNLNKLLYFHSGTGHLQKERMLLFICSLLYFPIIFFYFWAMHSCCSSVSYKLYSVHYAWQHFMTVAAWHGTVEYLELCLWTTAQKRFLQSSRTSQFAYQASDLLFLLAWWATAY